MGVLSVVIPAYNEEKMLPRTLDHLATQGGEIEVIVVDGGSTDRTCDIVRARADVRLVHARKGRASQMNAGARLARGEWLLFLHADTRLPERALAGLCRACIDRGYQAAGFRHRFSGRDWRLRVISTLHNFRCRLTGICYGDQALVIRADLFWRLGGFPDVPMLEDLIFGERLRNISRPGLLPWYVTTDSRKFEQRGILRSLGDVLLILACHKLGVTVRPVSFFRDIR
jgi:rSAM/selenodomain-associated transferase 2